MRCSYYIHYGTTSVDSMEICMVSVSIDVCEDGVKATILSV